MTAKIKYKNNGTSLSKAYRIMNFIIYVSILYLFIILLISHIAPSVLIIIVILSVLLWLITNLFLFWKLITLTKKIGISLGRIFQVIIKRIFDIIISLFLLLLFIPLILIITILIKMTSKGDAFFYQERIGLNGRKFIMYRFRTMVFGGPLYLKEEKSLTALSKSKFILQDDARTTRIGQILKKFSLDELPQLINVLKGEMSLVGPRPFISYEAKFSEANIKNIRLNVLPGITGLWQISDRNNFDFKSMIRLDQEYINKWSIFLDFKILLRTVKKGLLSGRGY